MVLFLEIKRLPNNRRTVITDSCAVHGVDPCILQVLYQCSLDT